MLEVRNLSVAYGRVTALRDVSLAVGAGEIVAVLGSNGAGKSSLLRAIVGQAPIASGQVLFDGTPIERRSTDAIVRLGLTLVPEGRRVFPRHTVEENLRLGAFAARSDHKKVRRLLDDEYARFPILAEKRKTQAGMLSGGQQQMLAISRALMCAPRFLMLDEPSLGLAPQIVAAVFRAVAELAGRGVTVLLVDQSVHASLSIAARAYILKNGAISLSGPADELLRHPEVREAYLGAAAGV
jgi:branched-chain amino acid transport system ATP-binding protein